jgi:general secretion pathway protein D
MRYELEGGNLVVMTDTPYLRNYKIDYVNMRRDSTSNISISTQIATTGAGVTGASGGTATSSGTNNSTTALTNTSNNRFWETLIQNIRDLLRETDKVLPEGSSDTITQQATTQSTTGTGTTGHQTYSTRAAAAAASNSIANSPNPATLQNVNTNVVTRSTFREAASVIANPETGIISVRATARQHEKVQEFIDLVLNSAQRQVMIEATVVEVTLSHDYQQGINWSRVRADGMPGIGLTQQPAGPNPLSTGATPPGTNNPAMFILSYTNTGSMIGNISAVISLLESFGKVKVLSSPKISVLNNQTALLKVVDNRVYFTVSVDITPATTTSAAVTTYTTTINTVPIGFVMSVTPQIDESNNVTMNVRPTISRILRYINDPNPALATAGVVSKIPEIQTREMESILKVLSGDVAVMGGLMQDSVENLTDGVPGLSSLPVVGEFFKYKNDSSVKSELVIFLRPVVIKQASLDGDFKAFRQQAPDKDFFNKPKGAGEPGLNKKSGSTP